MSAPWLAQYDPDVPATLSYPDCTLPDLLRQAVERYPDRPATGYYGATLTYRQLDHLTDRFAAALLTLRGTPGGVVGLMLPNLPQTVIAYFGGLKAGAAVTALNPLYVEQEIQRQVSDAGCDTLVALAQFYPRIEPVLRRGALKHVILTGPEDYLPWLKRLLYPWVRREGKAIARPVRSEVHAFRRLLEQSDGVAPRLQVSPDETALLQYTGGTTGIPKGVVLTHRNLIANAWQCRRWMPSLQEGQEKFLAVLPFFHVYGLSACQNLAVCVAGSLSLLPRFQVGEVLKTIEKDGITVFPGVPAMYAAINNHQHLEQHNLRSIRLCISGAGPLHPEVQDRFEALTGARLVEGYGLSEASPVTHVNPVGSKGRRRSIGLPLPDTDAKIVDAQQAGRVLPIGEIGELVIKGPQVMRGYWNRPEETEQVLKDGWLYTGDLARMDADGFFYLEDRKKDMIKSGGENVYPREVEEVLCRHPKVKEAVVVGLPQDLRGELIKAYVVLEDGQRATNAELLDHCRRELAKFKVPRKIEFRSALPKTIVGKVLRRVLIEEELKRREARAPERPA
ncbi:long-chain-fatty-acid--CoA ligase [Candidatus Nitrospira bockiana]